MNNFLDLKDNKLSIKYFFILMFLAFGFSILIRMIWIFQFADVESFRWNNEVMINTNDGYYYAEGARDILSGTHQENDLSPTQNPLSQLTAMIALALPVSFESLILYMPTFFGSLLVVPIMLIGRVFKQDTLGFIAALLGSIAWSYYNRTMTGYYDTDLLIVVLPTFFMWGVLYALNDENTDSFLIAPFFALLSMYWHSGTINIVNGVFILTLIYTFVFERKNLFYYQFLTVLVLALTTLPVIIKIISMILLVGAFHFLKEKLSQKIIIGLAVLSAFIYLIFGGFDWIVSVLNNAYVTRALHADDLNLSLHYFGVVNTVREAGNIPFEMFANRISGHTITFLLSVIGYILFIVRYKLFLLTLPMVVLGFFALQGGLRFTVFSVPFMAIGIAYFLFITTNIFQKLFTSGVQKYTKYGFIGITSLAILYPNISHVINYKVPTVFMKEEVSVLDKLGKIASREDYVVSWWDYGYPIRYYADVKTLIDGGKHSGGHNFPVSFALLNNQVLAANMMRFDVEYTEKNFKKKCGTSIECIMKSKNLDDPNIFLKSLNHKNIELPNKTRDIFVYLPNRMLHILPTVDLFSNLDLLTGKQKKRPLFIKTSIIGDDVKSVKFSNGIELLKDGGKIKIGNQVIPLNKFVTTEYDNNGILRKNIQSINPNSDMHVVFMKNYNQVLILEKRLYESLFIQLFVLESYDSDLFEKVILSPHAKVYKLKV